MGLTVRIKTVYLSLNNIDPGLIFSITKRAVSGQNYFIILDSKVIPFLSKISRKLIYADPFLVLASGKVYVLSCFS